MDDTRLWALKDSIEEGLRGAAAILDGPRIGPAGERDLTFGLRKDLMNAHEKVTALMSDSLCLIYSSVGSCCYRNLGHEQSHMSEWGHTWTDESDDAAAKQIVTSMKGKTE